MSNVPSMDPGSLGGGSIGSVAGINTSGSDFSAIFKGMSSVGDALMQRREMARKEAESCRNSAMEQQKMQMQQQKMDSDNELQQQKMQLLQSKQDQQMKRDSEDGQRKQLDMQMKTTDWTNKQAASQVIQQNIGQIDKILTEGSDNPAYHDTLSALYTVDPKSAVQIQIKNHKDMYDKNQKTVESAAYGTVAPILSDELPTIADKLSANPTANHTEVLGPLKAKLDALYSTGKIPVSVYTDSMQQALKLTLDLKKKHQGPTGGAQTYTSYDAQGQVTTDPTKAVRQVSSTGKMSSVGSQKAQNPIEAAIAKRMAERGK